MFYCICNYVFFIHKAVNFLSFPCYRSGMNLVIINKFIDNECYVQNIYFAIPGNLRRSFTSV